MLWVIMRIDFMSLQTLLLLWNKWIFSLDRWRAWPGWGPGGTSCRACRRDKTTSQSPPSAEERVGGNWPGLTRLCRQFSLGVCSRQSMPRFWECRWTVFLWACPAGARGQITSGDRRRDGPGRLSLKGLYVSSQSL